MQVVIQCAGKKAADAGYMVTAEGRRVMFVADPARAPLSADYVYATPNDEADDGRSWRQRVLSYNEAGENPLGLLPAYKLYSNVAYRSLVHRLGADNVYILSAAWGLIPAWFLTPYYDVTFQRQPEETAYKQRRRGDSYHDLSLLPLACGETLVFLGGKDYLPHFERLTNGYAGRRIAFFSSARRPSVSGIELLRYETTTRTNWHYECANALLAGTFSGLDSAALARTRPG